ncbi:MAG: ComEC/Rec2 family competence protein [Vicinamibacterales bacterium]
MTIRIRILVVAAVSLVAAIAGLAAQERAQPLTIYFIDTEGGQSTLFVAPSGESLLVDTGNAGARDLGRIVDALQTAGVTSIDHLWTTHYHGDHVGALLELARRFPVGHFYDHGAPNPDDRIVSAEFLAAYEAVSRGKRTIVKPGDTLQMAGVDITTVASGNQFIRSNLPGGGDRNPSCEAVPRKDERAYPDPDNGDSAGFVLTFGRFRTIDLGDLTWNGELDLMCPVNRIGTIDLYLTSHHGLEKSGSPALVQALRPRVVVMNNGTRKGGTAEAFASLHSTSGIEDLWQLHWSYNAGLENAPARFIANLDAPATIAGVLTSPPPAPGTPPPPRAGGPGRGPAAAAAAAHAPAYLVTVTAQQDGTFTVTNTRNNFSKTYARRP